MRQFILDPVCGKSPTILFIGAHSDDIEIGCGGTAIELLKRFPAARVHWVVLHAEGERADEARRACSRLVGRGRSVDLRLQTFRNAYFPSEWSGIKDYFEKLRREIDPDMIFCHLRDERHQDHRVVGELTWNTFRNHLILEYEIPKYDGAFEVPNFYVPLAPRSVERKLRLLARGFPSQQSRQWFSEDTFRGLMRLRGIECNAASGHAEAFVVRKTVLGFGARD